MSALFDPLLPGDNRWCAQYGDLFDCDEACSDYSECSICDCTSIEGITIEDLPFFGGAALLAFSGVSGGGSACTVDWAIVDGSNEAYLQVTIDQGTGVATAILTVTDGVDTCEYTASVADGLDVQCNDAAAEGWGIGSVTFQLSSGACSEVPFT